MHTHPAPMLRTRHRWTRAAGAICLISGTAALATLAPGVASAAVLGRISVSPTSGTDSTLFSGSIANAQCPAGTANSFFQIIGTDVGANGSGYLGDGNTTGRGPQEFVGASIANLKTTNTGSFSTSGAYAITFNCESAAGITDTYTATLNYVVGAVGAWTITVPARATATTLSATPAGPFELGTPTNLAADVTPTTGADNPTGSVEFFRRTDAGPAASLGIDNTLTATGVANLDGVSLPAGSNAITAVFTPASGANLTGSTSAATTVSVTPVAARPTSAVLTASPVSGNAYQAVTLTCAVAAGTSSPNGTANFVDGTTPIGSAPVVGGAPASLTTSTLAPGVHSLGCTFVGTAPYSNSTSNTVAASYVAVGATPDEQTVTVVIPAGVLTITTPYTPASPLALGTALLGADSTYSASAPFGTASDPDGAGPLTNSYITISDTRSGNLGWSASVLAGPFTNGASSFPGVHAGLTGLTKVPVTGNALLPANVTVTNIPPFAPGLGTPKVFASYPAGQSIGTANLFGTFGVDKVPTSVAPGTYTSTVTFTAV